MTISELGATSVFIYSISEIVIPFSYMIKRKEDEHKYQKLSTIPIETQRENYKSLLLQELSRI